MAGFREEKDETKAGTPVFIAIPNGAGPHPCMMLMHERYGLVQHTIDIAKRLATNGYLVAAPDLYHEFEDQAALHAGTATMRISDEAVVKQLESVLELIESSYGADTQRLAVMGVCATGRYPLAYASDHPVSACVTFYGGLNEESWSSNEMHPIPMDEYLANIKAPILGVYGEGDHTIPISDVLKFRDALERHNKSYQITIYPGMPHGWLNDTMPGRYRREMAERTWGELLAFLDSTLNQRDPSATGIIAWKFSSAKSVDYDFTKNVRYE